MNTRSISAWKLKNSARALLQRPEASPAARPELSRRQFTRAATGAAAMGAAAGLSLWKPRLVEGASFTPVPIPGGSPALGGAFHVFGPAGFDPVDAEPVTISNMNGFVGLAYLSGMATQTNTATGEVDRVPFVDSDLRFMAGVFKGADGRIHQGAFAFV